MNLLALVCTKCGGALNFKDSLVCECPACKTPHALIDSNGDLLFPVSYLPCVQRSDGKMEKSLKIRLVEKVRSDTNGKFVITDRDYVIDNFQKESLEIVDGRVIYNKMVFDDGGSLVVGLTDIFNVKFFGKVIYSGSRVTEICSVAVIPVMVKQDSKNMLAGHRILIRVYMPEYEEDANLFSGMIQDWFGIVPKLTLEKG